MRLALLASSVLVLAFLASGAPAAGQTTGYSLASTRLVALDLETGSFSVVATTGTFAVGGLTMATDGTLYSVSSAGDDLRRIDPATGDDTPVGPLGVDVDVDTGLAFDACGALWMITGGSLYQVDPVSGGATPVRAYGEEILALTARGEELVALVAEGAASRLASIDPAGGPPRPFGDPVLLPTFQAGLDFDGQGRLWAVYWLDGPVPGPWVSSIIRYDPVSGRVSSTLPLPIAQTRAVIGGNLAIAPPRGVCGGSVAIPASSGPALWALALLLGAAGLCSLSSRHGINPRSRPPARRSAVVRQRGDG